jgi:hypothetical protein
MSKAPLKRWEDKRKGRMGANVKAEEGKAGKR